MHDGVEFDANMIDFFDKALAEASVKAERLRQLMRRQRQQAFWARWVAPSGRWTVCHVPRACPPPMWLGGNGWLCGLPASERPAEEKAEWFRASLIEAKGQVLPDSVGRPCATRMNGFRAGEPFKPCKACVYALERGEPPAEFWSEGERVQSLR